VEIWGELFSRESRKSRVGNHTAQVILEGGRLAPLSTTPRRREWGSNVAAHIGELAGNVGKTHHVYGLNWFRHVKKTSEKEEDRGGTLRDDLLIPGVHTPCCTCSMRESGNVIIRRARK